MNMRHGESNFYSYNNNVFIRLSRIKVKGLLLFIILNIFLFFSFLNIFRSFSNAVNNHRVYLQEIQNYNTLKQKNNSLKKDLEYYTSDDYKLLFLRETQFLGKENESLFITRRQPVFLKEKESMVDLKKIKPTQWWWNFVIFGIE